MVTSLIKARAGTHHSWSSHPLCLIQRHRANRITVGVLEY